MNPFKMLSHGALVLALALSPGLFARAGDADTDGGDPDAGEEFGSGWNPTFTCEAEPGDSMYDILECLADGLARQGPPPCPPDTPEGPSSIGGGSSQPSDLQEKPSGSGDCNNPLAREDFTVMLLPPPHHGIRIRHNSGAEVERLLLWERAANVRMIDLLVIRPNLVARIGNVTQQPAKSGGLLTLTVNDTIFTVNTGLFDKGYQVTQELVDQARRAGYSVVPTRRYIFITRTPDGNPIHRLRMASNNVGITHSDLALLPEDEVDLSAAPGPLQVN